MTRDTCIQTTPAGILTVVANHDTHGTTTEKPKLGFFDAYDWGGTGILVYCVGGLLAWGDGPVTSLRVLVILALFFSGSLVCMCTGIGFCRRCLG